MLAGVEPYHATRSEDSPGELEAGTPMGGLGLDSTNITALLPSCNQTPPARLRQEKVTWEHKRAPGRGRGEKQALFRFSCQLSQSSDYLGQGKTHTAGWSRGGKRAGEGAASSHISATRRVYSTGNALDKSPLCCKGRW